MTPTNDSQAPPLAKAREPVLEMRGVSKTFPGVKALSNVSLTVYPGEIHALMGENGAGKSTLMKILAGAYHADAGGILIEGQPVRIAGPTDARHNGINIIYQELNLSPNLTVAENIFMGSERRAAFGLVDIPRMRREASAVLESLGASFGADTLVAKLSIAEQQQVEIARALHFKSRVLVMDEPTAALSERETERLFEIIRRLRDSGIAIVYISHRMAEVYALADRVTVLRDGQYVGTIPREDMTAERVVQMMVGRPLTDFYTRARAKQRGKVVLEVRNLGDARKVKDASFDLHEGEVLGLSGLVGAGRTELARLIFGADRAKQGEVRLNGRRLSLKNPAQSIKDGLGYLPENRKEQGLFLDMAARENITMSVLERNAMYGLLNDPGLNRTAWDAVKKMSIRVPHVSSLAGGLSGGNQQKLLVARWLAIGPRVLLLDEPTRGVDVGAKADIYRLIAEMSEAGVAVVFISSELPEVVAMSDRVLVMREGHLVGELDPQRGDPITQEDIMAYATGVRGDANLSVPSAAPHRQGAAA